MRLGVVSTNTTFRRMASRYHKAIDLLNSRRRPARPNARDDAVKSKPEPRGIPSLYGMKGWLEKLGHTESVLDRLNVVHVAGTKGKGATCAFVNYFLQAHGERTGFPKRIGLYTSPHLRYMQDRIRVDSQPLSEDAFADYVYEVWDALSHNGLPEPRCLQLLLLTAIHAFIKERVDVAVFETHNGGEHDATNIFQKPLATGIATIGLDHIHQLGPTIEKIAWHKAGIFKPGVPAFSVTQIPEAASVVQARAHEKGVCLEWIGFDPALPPAKVLTPDVQRTNASLALALSNAALDKLPNEDPQISAADIERALEQYRWDGRFHRLVQGNHQWYLDGAHNELSIEQAASWFGKETEQGRGANIPDTAKTRIVVFSHISNRDGAAILRLLAKTLSKQGVEIQHLILSTYDETTTGIAENDRCLKSSEQAFSEQLQEEYADAWRESDPSIDVRFEPTIEGALTRARELQNPDHGMQTLITGSLHLIGGALRLLESETA